VVADPAGAEVTATISSGIFTALTIVPGRTLEYNEGLYVFITPGKPLGVKLQKVDFRLVNTEESGLFLSGQDLKDEANGRFVGSPWPAGKQWGMRIAVLNSLTGAISAGITQNFLV
jgi:hypothetical protein